MGVETETNGDKSEVTIHVSGRFDFAIHDQFRKAYEGSVKPGARVEINLREVDYLDSSALGMLLLLREFVGEDDADVQITNANPEIKNILRVSNFERLFEIG